MGVEAIKWWVLRLNPVMGAGVKPGWVLGFISRGCWGYTLVGVGVTPWRVLVLIRVGFLGLIPVGCWSLSILDVGDKPGWALLSLVGVGVIPW